MAGAAAASIMLTGTPAVAEDMSDVPAEAHNCWAEGYGYYEGTGEARATCRPFAIGEQVRALAYCNEEWWFDYERYGPWVSSGTSYAYCDSGDRLNDRTYEHKIATRSDEDASDRVEEASPDSSEEGSSGGSEETSPDSAEDD
jgi:hypothetical protein